MSALDSLHRKTTPILVPKVPTYSDYSHYLKQIDEEKVYTNFGPLNSKLISRLGIYLGLESWQILTVANATLGIEGAILTSGVDSEGRWAVPSWTFTATAAACARSNIDFEFVDIDQSWRPTLKSEFTGLIDVLPFGDDLDFNRPYFQNLNCIIVDAAASFDALKRVKIPDGIPIAILISLHATKSLPAGEGGIFLTNDRNWAKRFRSWTNFGLDDNRISHFVGTNAKLSEMNCAIALASLDKWDQTRNEIQLRNSKALTLIKDYNLNTTSALEKNYATPYWIVKFKEINQKKQIELAFKESYFSTRNWWSSGCHTMPAYRNVPFHSLVETNNASNVSIGLPFHHELTDNYWEEVESIFSKFLA
jgi:dTDP-4-amino-4,6-dideoxygalactose transaminase